jgi:hypothetical protein
MAETGVTKVLATVRKCPHCAKVRELSLWATFNEETFYEEYIAFEVYSWRLLKCPACDKVILEKYSYQDNFTEILYPSIKMSSSMSTVIPHEIASEYDAALKIQEISSVACAVLIRRTLEVMCQYEKAKGRDLNAKIQALATSGRIPQPLADMAQLTRQIGNLGAHVDPSNDKVTEGDVTTMIDFLEAILEYLYVAPAKIAAVQARLKKAP